MHIRVLGTTGVASAQGDVGPGVFGGIKPRQILEILAVCAGTPVAKDKLAELLWDGHPPKSYLATLESYVCVLRRGLRKVGASGSAIATVPQGYVLDPERLSVDLVEFRELVRRARVERAEPALALALLVRALESVRGDLLASEAYAPWAVAERERFVHELHGAAVCAAGTAATLGDWSEAQRWASRAIELDGIDESAWRILMRAHWGSGRRSEALRCYFELRTLLDDELGSDPSPETSQLYLELLRGEVTGAPTLDPRAELRALVALMRRTVSGLPGVQVPGEDRALVAMAVDLMGVT
ncbi:hypothetical protein GCM10027425_00470 [Alteromonas gracilis]